MYIDVNEMRAAMRFLGVGGTEVYIYLFIYVYIYIYIYIHIHLGLTGLTLTGTRPTAPPMPLGVVFTQYR